MIHDLLDLLSKLSDLWLLPGQSGSPGKEITNKAISDLKYQPICKISPEPSSEKPQTQKPATPEQKA